jgi:hypothetical protein
VSSLLDVASTMIDALGAPALPHGHGRSLLPVARDAAAPWNDCVVAEHCTDRVPAWTGGREAQQRMLRDGRWKLIYYHGYPAQLFDLENDPTSAGSGRAVRARRRARPTARQVLEGWNPDAIAAASASGGSTRTSSTDGRATCVRATCFAGIFCRAQPARSFRTVMAHRLSGRGRASARMRIAGLPDLHDRDAEAVIAAAIERGIRFFDVAPLYGGGLAEERLGRALACPAPRRFRAVHQDRRDARLRDDGVASRPRGGASSIAGTTRASDARVGDDEPRRGCASNVSMSSISTTSRITCRRASKRTRSLRACASKAWWARSASARISPRPCAR